MGPYTRAHTARILSWGTDCRKPRTWGDRIGNIHWYEVCKNDTVSRHNIVRVLVGPESSRISSCSPWHGPYKQHVVWHPRQCYLGPVFLDNWLTGDRYSNLHTYIDATILHFTSSTMQGQPRARRLRSHYRSNTATHTFQHMAPYSYMCEQHDGHQFETSVVFHKYVWVWTVTNILPQLANLQCCSINMSRLND
jgi:hypothetical protein